MIPTIARIMRFLPAAGSGETVRAYDIAQRLGISGARVHKALSLAAQRGEVVRVRPGDYCLPTNGAPR